MTDFIVDGSSSLASNPMPLSPGISSDSSMKPGEKEPTNLGTLIGELVSMMRGPEDRNMDACFSGVTHNRWIGVRIGSALLVVSTGIGHLWDSN